jgi:cell division protein FtsZ
MQAAERAMSSPLLETSMEGAHGVLLSISGPPDVTLHEVSEAATAVNMHCDDDAQIIFGAVVDDTMGEEIRVTVIAAGFQRGRDRSGRGIASGATAPSGSQSLTPASSQPLPDPDDPFNIPDFVEG